jgi:uncharacterized protein DUF4330
MSVVDDQGRLFGRLNLIDAAVGLVGLVLIPLAYTAYVLFRTPAPSVTAIEPATLNVAPEMRVKLRGDGLRPLLRAFIGEVPSKAYLYENDHSVDVLFSGVQPGQHDLVLLDGVQEVVRVPKGITVVVPAEPPTVVVAVAGSIVGLDSRQAAQIAVGQRSAADDPWSMEVVEVGPPRPDARFLTLGDTNIVVPQDGLVQVPVFLRLRCAIIENTCAVPGGPLEPRRVVTLQHPSGTLRLAVDYVVPGNGARAAELTVRFLLDPASAAMVRQGDRDGSISNVGPAAQIQSVERQEVSGGELVRSVVESPGVTVERRVPGRVTVLTAVLRLDVHENAYGQRYRTQPLAVGGPFTFNGPGYQLSGSVIALRWIPQPANGQ